MTKVHFNHQAKTQECDLKLTGIFFSLIIENNQFEGEILSWVSPHFKIKMGAKIIEGLFFRGDHFVDIHTSEANFRIQFPKKNRQGASHSLLAGDVLAPMPGKILKLLARKGKKVEVGDCLMVIEAMKMEHKVLSPTLGEVVEIFFSEGDRVSQGEELLKIKES